MGRVVGAPEVAAAPGTTQAIRRLRVVALGAAVALPVAFWGTTFHAVPTADGLWRGMSDPPSTLRWAIAVVAGAIAAWLLGRRPPTVSTPLLTGLLAAAPLVPVWTGFGMPLLAFQRPGMILVACGALAVALVRSGVAGAPRRFWPFVAAFLFYVVVARQTPGPAGAQGDEPHYLLMAQSLLSDGDLDLADDLAGNEYASFYSGALRSHTSPASPPGTVYSIHTPGLAVLILPAYALGGVEGARLLMCLLAATAAAVVYRLVRDSSGSEEIAGGCWAALALTPPLAFYAVALYPEVPACLAAAVFLTTSRRDPGAKALAIAALSAAALPWIHPKFLPLAALGLALTVVRRGPRWPRLLAASAFALSVVLLFYFFQATYGRASLSAAYGPGFGADVTLGRIPWGILGLLADRQFGLFFTSPVWLLALPGLAVLLRHRTGDALRALLLGGSALAVGASFSMWWGGTCPPARFVVPALPAAALALSRLLDARRTVVAALLGVGVGIVLLAADAPRVLHNRADGESALFRHLSPALDLDRCFPSFVIEEPHAVLLALSLLAACLLAWQGGRRGVAVGLAGYALVVSGIRPGPWLDARRAPVAALEAWDVDTPSGVMGPLDPTRVSIPVELPGAPWTLRAEDERRSRFFDLPPGDYRLEVDGRVVEALPTARVARLDVVSGSDLLLRMYLREDQPPPRAALSLPSGGRRLVFEASGIQGTGVIDSVRVMPETIVPRRERRRQ